MTGRASGSGGAQWVVVSGRGSEYPQSRPFHSHRTRRVPWRLTPCAHPGYFTRAAKAGLVELVGKVALPALLFRAIATLNLSDLKPEFILGVLVSKVLLFLLAVASAQIAGKPLADVAMWGLFVSNSNDLAQGQPLFLALTTSAYAHQLYITAALQVALLNPVAFLLLEVDHARRAGRRTSVSELISGGVVEARRPPASPPSSSSCPAPPLASRGSGGGPQCRARRVLPCGWPGPPQPSRDDGHPRRRRQRRLGWLAS